MRFSVALCTYEGERFLAEQLASILNQVRPPDELIVCDDASTDGSAAMAREFAARAPFRVRVEVNAATLGTTGNFARAIGLCTGHIIALCDQDDVWLPHKLATLEGTFLADPLAELTFSDAAIVDERLTPLGYTLWNALRFARSERNRFRRGEAFEALLKRHRVTGATMAFRAELRDRFLPIPPLWFHDAWIALVVVAAARVALVEEPMVWYRRHEGQQIGGQKRGPYGEYLAARRSSQNQFAAVAMRYSELRDHLIGLPGIPPARLRALEEKIQHSLRRATMRNPGTWRLPHVLREVVRGNYARFSRGWKAVAQDLFLG